MEVGFNNFLKNLKKSLTKKNKYDIMGKSKVELVSHRQILIETVNIVKACFRAIIILEYKCVFLFYLVKHGKRCLRYK